MREVFSGLLLAAMFTACAGIGQAHGAPPPSRRPAAGSQTITVVAPARYTKNSYRGRPDLGLVVAIVQAGGGPGRFDGNRLLTVLAGGNPKPELARLRKQYGKARVDAFVQTMTFSMVDLLQIFNENHVALPARARVSPGDGRAMALAIYHDGIMPNGKYDCGYMMEHLMTHPIHIVLMHDVDNVRGFGRSHNASFHTILTRAVVDLKNTYGKSRPRQANARPARSHPG